ncbi:hypothetical protein EDB85DRAFT_2293300 [Lactarius pseudohatsudake]|nr:hypothetical protein EDB85DRAFT_2293300 [Lactarius pseudohatsudake]
MVRLPIRTFEWLEPAQPSWSQLNWEWLSSARLFLVELCLAEPSQAEPSHGNTTRLCHRLGDSVLNKLNECSVNPDRSSAMAVGWIWDLLPLSSRSSRSRSFSVLLVSCQLLLLSALLALLMAELIEKEKHEHEHEHDRREPMDVDAPEPTSSPSPSHPSSPRGLPFPGTVVDGAQAVVHYDL